MRLSGLNAHWSPAALAEEFGRLRAAAFATAPDPVPNGPAGDPVGPPAGA